MQIVVPYNYLILMAFKNMKKYENKNIIDIKSLQNYIKAVLTEVKLIYEDKTEEEYTYDAKIDQWHGKIYFKSKHNFIEEFLNKYGEYFIIDENNIVARNDIDIEDYYQFLSKEKAKNKISNRFDTPTEHKNALLALKVQSIQTLLNNYLTNEKKLEIALENNAPLKEIAKHYIIRDVFLKRINRLPFYVIDSFRNLSYILKTESENVRTENYEVPINLDLWYQSAYFDNKNPDKDIDYRINDLFQYAIFGNDSLAEEKLLIMLEDLYFLKDMDSIMNDEEEEEEIDYDEIEYPEDCENSENEEDTEYDFDDDYDFDEIDEAENYELFYLTYIKRINNYFLKYGDNSELQKVKKRLLYLLDMPEKSLVNEYVLEEEIAKLENKELGESFIKFIEDEVKFLGDEIFSVGRNEYTIRKLLFMGTYYELTQDEEFKKIIKKHKYDKNYANFEPLIFGEIDDYVLKRTK